MSDANNEAKNIEEVTELTQPEAVQNDDEKSEEAVVTEEEIIEEAPSEEAQTADSEEQPSDEITEEPAEGTDEEQPSEEGDEEASEEQSSEEENGEAESTPEDEASQELPKEDLGTINVELIDSPYIEKQYLRFGGKEVPSFIDTVGTLSYLEEHGFGDNNLTQAREKIKESEFYEKAITRIKQDVHYCDFCGKELGVEYDVLSDGRERCNDCSRTIVKSVEDLSEIFIEIERNMEVMFGINYFTSIDVKFADSKKIARHFKEVFVATSGYDPRTLGFAEDRNGAYSIWVENQSPYLSSVATIAHELTHIWQYLNWDRKQIIKTYFKPLKQKFPTMDPRLLIYEGMAKWAEVQYLFFINEYQRANIEIERNLGRPDEYGVGFALFYREYGLTRGTFPQGATPFMDKQYPLHEY